MSRLAVGDDDHPEAARKHYLDAQSLLAGGRFDGAAYLAGYVLECSLKAVLLHDRPFDPVTRVTDQVQLNTWHQQLRRRPFQHDLARLLAEQVGPEGARYVPPLDPGASIFNWSESLRYMATGAIPEPRADAYVLWAGIAVDAVVRMALDGVLVELGVLRKRANDLFDVPDLYLQGLDLRRKGGVAKK
jgi:hypothetical protein